LNTISDDERLARAVLRLNGGVLGLASGAASGLALFVATNWLVVKGGDPVGPHLSLLGQFFIGYSVTFAGSFIGLAYGFATGFLLGWLLAWVYNAVVFLKRGYAAKS
jgi:hypothetical protein